MHIGVGDQAVFLAQLRRGVAAIAKNAEILRPGTFTHDKHRQGFAPVGLPGRIAPGIFTEFHKRLMCRRNLFTQVTGRGAKVVAWHYHQAQLVVIAKQ
ncbi:hypothetical protein D3C71_1541650 [compost metagenome]